jgi:signal transduction histidine kinase
MATSQPSDVREGALRPLWFGQTLVLARRVEADGKTYVQGCWLDWPVIRQNLLGAIRDLLPTAQLEPFSGSAAPKGVHLLATLPVRLVPGDVPVEENGGLSALELALLWAWAAALIVAVVIGVVLGQAVALSERRGAFVSAVTHELRTPLTTFRLYTELLAEGAVAAEDKRRQYLETLRREAERLGLLVENVLSYARLERNRHGTRIEAIALGTLFERVRPRLDDRAAQAQMRLELQLPQDAASWAVRTDPGAAEQILLNLVDNACKYAACADNKTILVRAARSGRLVTLLVRDYGPGVADTRRLFRPFSKSAREAAQSAPGVGLGLALSRRLARQMGGDLAWDQAVTDGAAFVLTLPAAAAAEKDPHRRQFSCDA